MSVCGICREAKEDIVNTHLQFTHLFCKNCLADWIITSGDLNCPLCHRIIDNCREFFDDKEKLLNLLWKREDGYDIIKGLLEEGLDPGDMRDMILKNAITFGNVEVVRIFVRDLEEVPNVDPAGLVKTGEFDLLHYFMTPENMQDFGKNVLYELV